MIPPNRQWKYSNLGYQLLGEIVARVSGSPYTDYVSEKILQPLGMSATSFEPLPGQLAARVATGYAGRSFSDELEVAPTMPPIFAEGGLWSCVEDLSRWVDLQLGAYRDAGAEKSTTGALVLSADDRKEMHKPRYLVDDEWTSAWGISWSAVRKDDVIWVQHSGGLPGHCTNVCFDPKSGLGAIALVNGDGDASALAMGLAGVARDAAQREGFGAHGSTGDAGALPAVSRGVPRSRHVPRPRVARRQAHLPGQRRTRPGSRRSRPQTTRTPSWSSLGSGSPASPRPSSACLTVASPRSTSPPSACAARTTSERVADSVPMCLCRRSQEGERSRPGRVRRASGRRNGSLTVPETRGP